MILSYVESDVGMAMDRATVAWVFDLQVWGRCGQGPDETSALASLVAEIGVSVQPVVTERIVGDEQAFLRDKQPATSAERDATLAILAAARQETLALLAACSADVLDFDDPQRTLPAFANWRTLRQMAWHLADTESRYYLPATGLPSRDREINLTAELTASAQHVRTSIATMPADLIRRTDGETWTATKLLRRLAWHERSELVTMHQLAIRARQCGPVRRCEP